MRWRWRIVCVVCAIAAAALAWLLTPRRAQRERLTAALWAEERANDLRPTHATPPLAGGFGALLEPHLAGLHESFDTYAQMGEGGRETVARVFAGREPVARLAPLLLEDLALHRRAMLGALRATHAEAARAPESFRLLATLRPANRILEAVHADRLAALDLLLLLDQGRNDEAAEECADALALGRDLSYPSLIGRMHGLSAAALVAAPCARALSLASAQTIERVRSELLQIRRGTPRFAHLLERERLFAQLWLVDKDPRMPESARLAIEDLQTPLTPRLARLRWRLFRETAWGSYEEETQALLAAQRQGWPSCLDATAAAARLSTGWNRAFGEGEPSSIPTLLRRHRDGLLELDAMICLASASLVRARKGALPRSTPSVCPPPEPEATCGEQSAPLRIAADSRGSRVAVRLSDGTEYALSFARPPRAAVHKKKRVKRAVAKERRRRSS